MDMAAHGLINNEIQRFQLKHPFSEVKRESANLSARMKPYESIALCILAFGGKWSISAQYTEAPHPHSRHGGTPKDRSSNDLEIIYSAGIGWYRVIPLEFVHGTVFSYTLQ
ncbi:uncharacterized protein LOC143306133 [Osmia lignaria lignaria]|uniref:uncharacterized protein LOC143306133 n=1 Tax=Osmia lignaria lignaria TaxID=1437193 RepID=UPI00402BAFF0